MIRRKLFCALTVFLFTLSIPSCVKEEDRFCDCSNPIRQLDWLKERISDSKKYGPTLSIYQTSYNSMEVFYVEFGSGLSSCTYDCSGIELCSFADFSGVSTCSDFNTDTSLMELIWSNVEE